MELRSVLKAVLIGIAAYVCIMPVTLAWLTLSLNLRIMPEDSAIASVPVLYFVLRFGLFLIIGLVVGRRVACLKVANATLAGFFLANGASAVDTAILFLAPRRPVVSGDVPLASEGLFAGVYTFLIWFGLEIVLATAGGLIAKLTVRGRSNRCQAHTG